MYDIVMVKLHEYRGMADFDSKRREALETLLYTDETFIYAIDIYDAIIFRKWRATKLVLTDQRIISFKRGFIKESSRDFSLDEIVSIEHKKGYLYRKIEIGGHGVSKEFQTLQDVGKKFVTTAREQMNRRDEGREPISTIGQPIEMDSTKDFDDSLTEKFGSVKLHIIIAILTIWWTLGIANLIYEGYSYYQFTNN